MTGKKFKAILIILISILVCIIIAFGVYAVLNEYSFKDIYIKMFPDSVDGIYRQYASVDLSNEEIVFSAGGGEYIYIITDKELTIYDKTGSIVKEVILYYEQTGISSNGKYTVVYDKKTGAYKTYKEGDKKFEESFQRPILNVVMQKNGYAVFVLKGKDGFLGSVVIINNKNETIATCNYSDRYPVSGCVSDNSEFFAVSGINGNNTEQTDVDIYEMYNPVPVAGININALLPWMMSLGNEAFVMAGEEQIKIFSFSGIEINTLTYTGIIRITGDYGSCYITVKGAGGDYIIKIDATGEEQWRYHTGIITDGMTAGEDFVFYWSGRETVCLDLNGQTVEMQSGFELVSDIVYFGEGKVAVITSEGLALYEFE